MSSKSYTNEQKNEIKLFFLKVLHFILSVCFFSIFWYINRGDSGRYTFGGAFRRIFVIPLCFAFLFLFFVRTYNSYLLGYTRVRNLVLSEFFSQFFSTVTTCLFTYIFWETVYNVWSFILLLFIDGLLDVVWAYRSNRYYYRLCPPRKAVLIYKNDNDKLRFDTLSGKASEKMYEIQKEICYQGNSFSEIKNSLEGYEAVFVAGINSRCRNGIAKYCMEKNVAGYFIPHTGDIIMQGAMHIQTFDSPIFYLTRKRLAPEYKYIKRIFDVTFSFLGLITLSPLMLAIAGIVHFSDGGPAIYKQRRLTTNGSVFNIYKFRTMRVDAEHDGIARLSTGSEDNRVTPVGKVLRRYRLDELPQLLNILIGDMSFVGPRPERPEIAEEYYNTIPGFFLRLQVKAGLTGYAQVYGRYNTDPYEKLQFDLIYINKMNLFTDLRLIFATLSTLFSAKSTEGIREKTDSDEYSESSGKKKTKKA